MLICTRVFVLNTFHPGIHHNISAALVYSDGSLNSLITGFNAIEKANIFVNSFLKKLPKQIAFKWCILFHFVLGNRSFMNAK